MLFVVSCSKSDDPFLGGLSITSSNSATFSEGTANTFTITATGFPRPTFSITGTLPSGVTLDAGTGVLSGVPAYGSNGTYPLVITASNGIFRPTQNFTLTVSQAAQTFGVVALSTVGSIGIFDGNTDTITPVSLLDKAVAAPLLTRELGSFGGGLFDVVITPDGKTTIVSNFGDSTIYFINTTNPAAPVVLGSAVIPFFAEDMAITPDGKYVLVTDGGFSARIAVVDIATRTLVENFNTNDHQGQAIAITPDGQTVLIADYWNLYVHVYTINAAGHLTYKSSIDVSNPVWDPVDESYVKTLRPVNITISPDGKTAIVASVPGDKDVAGTIRADMTYPVLSITGPGMVALSDMVVSTSTLRGSQTVVFNRAGSKAYVMCTVPLPDPIPVDPHDPSLRNMVAVLNISSSGVVTDSGTLIPVEIYGTSQLFGVDTMAVDNPGKNLYVSNPTLSGARNYVQVIDLATNFIIKTYWFDAVNTAAPGDPPVYDPSFPTGIAFWHR